MRPIHRALMMTPAILPAAAWAQGPGPMHDWGWGWGGMVFGPLLMIAWLALLVVVIVLVVRWLGGGSFGMGSPHRTPREILDERFAKGEIDQDEYEKRRKTLGL